ncbi:MAG: 4-hydroxy-3-methylbut-2-enyl diphosphate reductase [Armatimonadota bacterium]
MEVILADSAGFCYGVRRAIETVLAVAKTVGKPMFTLGPVIHNPQVIAKLESVGIASVASLDEVPPGSVIVMPSHGVPRQVMERAKESGLEIVDLVCPFVRKVHCIAETLVKDGCQVIVLGDAGHTEVRGIMSVAGEDAVAVSDIGELAGCELARRVGVVAQTTQTVERFRRLVAEVAGRVHEIRAFNTICNATLDRQRAALAVTEMVDVMLVVGGRNSANTRRLAEICRETGVRTYHVEVAGEMDAGWFHETKRVGVTAGASTPDWIIEEVVEKIRSQQ